jgi:transposase
MGIVKVFGLDLAKNVLQVHGVDAEGEVVLRQSVARAKMLKLFGKLPPCLVGIEACATSH